jgi:hypothetical protein
MNHRLPRPNHHQAQRAGAVCLRYAVPSPKLLQTNAVDSLTPLLLWKSKPGVHDNASRCTYPATQIVTNLVIQTVRLHLLSLVGPMPFVEDDKHARCGI